jgi:type IV pilus modification protein PilV
MRRMNGRAQGFTLIETLVALVVLSVGLLGAVALLMVSLRGQMDARRESETMWLLRDVADRVRANVSACASMVPAMPCDSASLTDERSRFAGAANVLYPNGATTASIDFAPATGAAPDRYVITLRFAEAVRVNVLSLQVHARALVAG